MLYEKELKMYILWCITKSEETEAEKIQSCKGDVKPYRHNRGSCTTDVKCEIIIKKRFCSKQ